MFTPKEAANNYLNACETKASLPFGRMLVLAVLAGMFIAMAGVASGAASATVENASLARLVSGLVFPGGLSMVLIAGSELFTGNSLMIMGVLSRRIRLSGLLRNYLVVYLGNLAGAFFLKSLLPATLGNLVGGVVLVGCVGWQLFLAPDREAAAAGK